MVVVECDNLIYNILWFVIFLGMNPVASQVGSKRRSFWSPGREAIAQLFGCLIDVLHGSVAMVFDKWFNHRIQVFWWQHFLISVVMAIDDLGLCAHEIVRARLAVSKRGKNRKTVTVRLAISRASSYLETSRLQLDKPY